MRGLPCVSFLQLCMQGSKSMEQMATWLGLEARGTVTSEHDLALVPCPTDSALRLRRQAARFGTMVKRFRSPGLALTCSFSARSASERVVPVGVMASFGA